MKPIIVTLIFTMVIGLIVGFSMGFNIILLIALPLDGLYLAYYFGECLANDSTT